MITAAFQNNVHKLLRLCSISLATFALLDSGQPSHGQSLRQDYEANKTHNAAIYERYQKELKQKAGMLKEAQYGRTSFSASRSMAYNRSNLTVRHNTHVLKLENDAVYRFNFAVKPSARKTGWQKIGPLNKTFQVTINEITRLRPYLVQYTKESGKLCSYLKRMGSSSSAIQKNCHDRLSPEQVKGIVSSFLYQDPINKPKTDPPVYPLSADEKARELTYWQF